MPNPTSLTFLAIAAVLAAVLAASAAAHGFVTDPRYRGALYLPRIIKSAGLEHLVAEADVGGNVGWADCPHCSNGGGVNVLKAFVPGAKFHMFEPLNGKFRKGVSLCGDKPGSNDHSAAGKYGAPEVLPFVASYTAGGVANFQFDLNTPHGGYLEFYLCDVGASGDISEASFAGGDCYLLERGPSAACEAGTLKHMCGPIDPVYKSRWYLPCRESDNQFQNQIVGGSDGSMAYKIPNVPMEKAVIAAYWLTSNSCNPRGHKEYFQSGVWPAVDGCPGDGNTVGGFNSDHTGDCDTQPGKWPEEFFNCADVEILGAGAKSTKVKYEKDVATAAPVEATAAPVETTAATVDTTNVSSSTQAGQSAEATTTVSPTKKETKQAAIPETKPSTRKGADEPSATTENISAKEPKVDFQLRVGCMPPFNEKKAQNVHYVGYYKQLQQYCRDRRSNDYKTMSTKAAEDKKSYAGKSESPTQVEATTEEESKETPGESVGDGNCVDMGEFCAGKTCCGSAACSRVDGDGKVGRVCT